MRWNLVVGALLPFLFAGCSSNDRLVVRVGVAKLVDGGCFEGAATTGWSLDCGVHEGGVKVIGAEGAPGVSPRGLVLLGPKNTSLRFVLEDGRSFQAATDAQGFLAFTVDTDVPIDHLVIRSTGAQDLKCSAAIGAFCDVGSP